MQILQAMCHKCKQLKQNVPCFRGLKPQVGAGFNMHLTHHKCMSYPLSLVVSLDTALVTRVLGLDDLLDLAEELNSTRICMMFTQFTYIHLSEIK